MKTLTKLSLAVMMATGSVIATADDNNEALRQELAAAQAELAQLKAQLAQSEQRSKQLYQNAEGKYVEHDNTATHVTQGTTTGTLGTAHSTQQRGTDGLQKAIFIPANLKDHKIDRDEDDNKISVSGEVEHGNVRALANQARQALQDSGFTPVRENLDDDDEAKLVYEKVTGDVRETIEIEIEESWLTNDIDYEVEYEKHSAEIDAVRQERRTAYINSEEYQQHMANLPAGVFVPSNLHDIDVDRDADGNYVEISGDIDGGSVQALAQQARQALLDAGYVVVKEDIDDDDDAKLVYEKVSGQIRETIEVEIDESWLFDNIDYEVEYEKHY